MNLEYTWTRENLREKLHKMRKVPNIIFLIMGVLFYVYFIWYGLMEEAFDTKVILFWFIVYFMVLILFLLVTTKLYVFINLLRNDRKTSKVYGTYHIKANDERIISEINEEIISYKWKDITKFKKEKNSFFIATEEDRLGLRFDKNCLKDDKYEKLLKYVEERLSEV